MPYRLVYIGLGSLAIAVIALGVVFGRGGEPIELPDPVQSVFPLPNDATLRQAVIEVDMEIGYELTIFVDGFRVPDTEVVFIEGTGVSRWAPSPNGLYLTEWSPGAHTVRIEWSSISGLPDIGSFEWEFRVQ